MTSNNEKEAPLHLKGLSGFQVIEQEVDVLELSVHAEEVWTGEEYASVATLEIETPAGSVGVTLERESALQVADQLRDAVQGENDDG